MEKKLNTLYHRVGIKSDRTKNITKHVLLSAIYKGGSILAGFLLVPLTMSYLDNENYGIWLTLSSFIAWFSFFDIGLGNGLRNKFAEAKAIGDMTLARAYVSAAYFTIGAVSLGLTLLFFLVNYFIDWTKVFNSSPSLQKNLSILMPIVFGFFCLQLVTKLITTIYTADQHHSMQGKINFFTQTGSLLVIWIMTKTAESSLLIFGTIFSILPVIILLGLNFFAFNNRYKVIKPTFTLWKMEYLNAIFGLGLKFFIIQICWVIITSTDNIIISQLFSPKEVVPYTIAFKYFSISTMIFTIIVTPYWSSFTEAYIKHDFTWIKKSMNTLFKFIGLFFFLSIMLLVLSDKLYSLWIGKGVVIPFNINLLMCMYTCMIIYLTPFNYFINGIGKVKLQLIQTVLMAALNIPLSIFFASYLKFGVAGVLLGTIISIIPSLFLSSIQFYLISNKKSYGIWER